LILQFIIQIDIFNEVYNIFVGRKTEDIFNVSIRIILMTS